MPIFRLLAGRKEFEPARIHLPDRPFSSGTAFLFELPEADAKLSRAQEASVQLGEAFIRRGKRKSEGSYPEGG